MKVSRQLMRKANRTAIKAASREHKDQLANLDAIRDYADIVKIMNEKKD